MRSIFHSDAAIARLVGAMLLEQNDEWSLNRRYMQLEGLQSLSDTAPPRRVCNSALSSVYFSPSGLTDFRHVQGRDRVK
jgi:hypothetical protein